MGGRVTVWWLWAGVLSAGCNTLAGIDGDYVMAEGPLGGSGVGAQVGTSGAGASWGEGGSYGAGGGAGADGASGANGVGGEATPGASGASGAAAASGSAGTDPSDAGGGSGGTGDSDAAGGTGATPCPPGQKRCGEACVEPGAAFGCSLTDCSPCPDPVPNSEVICGDEQCVAQCKQNFVPVGGQCVPQGSIDGGGGAGGEGGGNGGSGGIRQCVVSECPSCSLFRGEACCTFFRTCGCSFADRIYCI